MRLAALLSIVGLLVGCGVAARTVGISDSARLIQQGLQPPSHVQARRLGPNARAYHLLSPGAAMPSDFTGMRFFSSPSAAFAIGAPRRFVGVIYPLHTSNGGKTWRVAGPALYTQGAHAGLAVGQAGVIGPRIWFACCGLNGVVDVTPNAGKVWWQTFFPGEVLTVYPGPSMCGRLIAIVQPFSKRPNPPLWTYASNSGRRWTDLRNPNSQSCVR